MHKYEAYIPLNEYLLSGQYFAKRVTCIISFDPYDKILDNYSTAFNGFFGDFSDAFLFCMTNISCVNDCNMPNNSYSYNFKSKY